tara:strand:+ start:2163 stop:3605 length:1443 start_codon:yes stop_codon:yes gene_type:complete
MSNVLGFSEGYHDAAVTILDGHEIVFAAHDERFSKTKNNKYLSPEFMEYVNNKYTWEHAAFYERPHIKALRHLYQRRWSYAFKPRKLGYKYSQCFSHHLSHAAAAFQCSPFEKATALVVDAIGEFDTISQWNCWYEKSYLGKQVARYKKVSSIRFPLSIGLFYSAITDRVGLKPMEDEYILMGMAAYGKDNIALYEAMKRLMKKHNLDRGCKDFAPHASDEDLAFNAQLLTERLLKGMINKIDGPIVYGGGVAHNVVANRKIFNNKRHFIFPNPGDAGSSLGAAALVKKKKINFEHCFTGKDAGDLNDISSVVDHIINHGIVGVSAGRAEFGPRALGNRSLLADPRDPNIKDKVNEIKKRQKFRPFAPSVLSEHASDYFAVSTLENYDFMQYAIPCIRKQDIPSVVHVDGTSRVHTVSKQSAKHSPLRDILEEFYHRTSCPILLNTSLNIKGQPMVNDLEDSKMFEEKYNVKVYNGNTKD